MKFRTFALFAAPSAIVMTALILLPLIYVLWLSVHQSYVETHLVEVKTVIPVFAGVTRTETKVEPQAVTDAQGRPVKISRIVGAGNYAAVVQPDKVAEALARKRPANGWIAGLYRDITTIAFWGALEFTILYVAVTTPAMLLLGLVLALAVNAAARRLRGALIFASLLPFIITPIVGALSIYWLFLDNAVANSVLQALGFGKYYFQSNALSIRSLIIGYGIWSSAPFAFIVLYAGLQTLPQDPIEAAMVDGASRWQRLRYVVVPHLMPLMIFVGLIHLMDAYRVFEPILVFGSALYANSMQYMTYQILNGEDNFNKAAAAAVLTVVGIVLLLVPVLRRTWREQRGVA